MTPEGFSTSPPCFSANIEQGVSKAYSSSDIMGKVLLLCSSVAHVEATRLMLYLQQQQQHVDAQVNTLMTNLHARSSISGFLIRE